jgi:hypothetical protein
MNEEDMAEETENEETLAQAAAAFKSEHTRCKNKINIINAFTLFGPFTPAAHLSQL